MIFPILGYFKVIRIQYYVCMCTYSYILWDYKYYFINDLFYIALFFIFCYVMKKVSEFHHANSKAIFTTISASVNINLTLPFHIIVLKYKTITSTMLF